MAGKIIDIVGNIYSEWKVLSFAKRIKGRTFWNCKCSCGTEKEVDGADLKRNVTKSCGHNNKVDLTEKIFGNWKVLKSSRITEKFVHFWLCECVCGKRIEVTHGNLMNGVSKSCGCINLTLPEIKIGMKFNEWEVIGDSIIKNKRKAWFCRCSCGKEKYVEYKSLLSGASTHCGHLRTDGIEIGMIFGRLKVMEKGEQTKTGNYKYICLCKCGNYSSIRASELKDGSTISCGCYASEQASIRASNNQKKFNGVKRGYTWYFYDNLKNKIHCKSSYEVFFWNYFNFIQKIKIKYEPKTFVITKSTRYTPDFYLPKTKEWFETKGSFYAYDNQYGKQLENIEILSKKINLKILFWKDIVKVCGLECKSLSTYFRRAKKLNIPVEDYLAEMQYLNN